MGAKLTKAQRRFLTQSAEGWTFSRDYLSGAEWRMAERLTERGLLTCRRGWESLYLITDAGRAALSLAEPPETST